MLDANRFDPQAPVDAKNLGARHDLDPRGTRGIRQRALGFGAKIGDQLDADARFVEIERRAIGAVMRGRDDDAIAHPCAILIAVAARGVCEHHRWPVVVRKHERTLDRAGRQHQFARAHLP